MHRLLIVLSIIFCYFFPSVIFAQQQFEGKVIEKVNIIPISPSAKGKFDEKSVIDSLKTRKGTTFSQSVFDQDLKNMYERFSIVDPLPIKVIDGKLHITVQVAPKPKIRSIIWKGNEGIKTKKLKKELKIEPKSIFNQQEFNKAFQKLKMLYAKKGYSYAKLTYETAPIKDTQEIDIIININEGKPFKINKIAFKNFTKKEREKISDAMVTKKYFFLTSWLKNTGIYQEEAMEYDKINILKELHNEGYADAKVDIKVEEVRKKRINIIITADKGERYHFGKITFDGNKLFDDEQIQKVILAKPGNVYSPEVLQNTVKAIKDLYGVKGYIEAFVNYETRLDLDKPVYSVHFSITEGQQYRVGMIKIFGNTVTQDNVILHEIKLIPGEIFNSRKLKISENTLIQMDYFEHVNVYTVKSNIGPQFKDVHIEVEEKGTGALNFSLGFSTASSFFGGVSLSERNFNYKGFSEIFSNGIRSLRGGGEFAKASVLWGVRQKRYGIEWAKPHFMDSKWTVGFRANRTEDGRQSDDYYLFSWGLSVFGIYHFNDYVALDLTYRIVDTKVKMRKDPDNIDPRIEEEKNQSNGLLSGISAALRYDSTDRMYDPTRGIYSTLGAEFVGVGGDYTFMNYFYNNSAYYSPFKTGILRKSTIKGLANLQFLQPMGRTTTPKVPLGERLFLGGEDTVRGYRYNHIGPKYADNQTPRGGISSLLLSGEYIYRFHPMVDGFLHVDGGAVSFERFRISTMRFSYGFGARIKVLGNVPIVVGMGFPINPESRGDVKRFYVSLGFGF